MRYREYTKKSTGEMRIVCDPCGAPTPWKIDRAELIKWKENHVCPDMSKYNNIRF